MKAQRSANPEAWGPMTADQLIRALGRGHEAACDEASRWGYHPTDAYLVAFKLLKQRCEKGQELMVDRLPFHAQRAAVCVQLHCAV